jgi:DNA processing protein
MAITSGLALGIDACAHRGALDAHGVTIAVAATGLDRVYPSRHRELAHEIAKSGALVSEFPLGSPPRRDHFPRRNRIISGMSTGVVVVEAALRSGSLITARLAGEQGREVFAIPGSIHSPLARGCHALIRQGAKLVETARDILEELGPLVQVQMGTAPAQDIANDSGGPQSKENPEYEKIFAHLGHDPVDVDTLVDRSGLTPEVISSMLLQMELYGLIEACPGGKYQRSS